MFFGTSTRERNGSQLVRKIAGLSLWLRRLASPITFDELLEDFLLRKSCVHLKEVINNKIDCSL